MDENGKKISWLKVVLAIVSLIGLSVLYILIKKVSISTGLLELMENVIPDLVAVLIIVPIIYFVFTRKGITSENSFVNSIVSKINGPHIRLQEKDFSKEELRTDIRQSDEIIIIGLYLSSTINENHSFFEEQLKKNKKITFILIDPNDDGTIIKSSKRFKEKVRFSPLQVKGEINLRISQLENIRSTLNKTQKKNMRIMTIDYPLNFGGYLTRRKNLGAKILVKLYGYQTKDLNFLRINLTPRDGKVFENYIEQFENIVYDAKDFHRN